MSFSVSGSQLLPSSRAEAKLLIRQAGLEMTVLATAHRGTIQNSGVVGHLKSAHGQSEEDGIRWMTHWIERGLHAFQDMIEPDAKFCFGDQPGFADVCLIPQLYNAKRWGVSMAPLSRLKRIEFNCMRLAAFSEARPEKQPDAEK